MTHEQFREMLPLYVVGALDGDELLEFERFVAANRATCESEIAGWQACADQLAFSAPAAVPSPAVEEQIMVRIDETHSPVRSSVRLLPKPAAERLDWQSLLLGWLPWTATAVLSVVLVGAVLTRREMQRRNDDLTMQAAEQRPVLLRQNQRIGELKAQLEEKARALANLEEFKRAVEQYRVSNDDLRHEMEILKTSNETLVGEKANLMRAAEELRQRVARQDLQVATLRQEMDFVMDPAVRVMQLSDPSHASKATAKVYWHDARKTGRVVVSNLVPVRQGQNKCLELWAFCGDQPPVPAGLFWTDDAGHGVTEIKLSKQLACVSKFAVSVEPTGGVPAPTGPVVLLGQ